MVTAPTNGSAGVIPARCDVLFGNRNHEAGEKKSKQFSMVAGAKLVSIFAKELPFQQLWVVVRRKLAFPSALHAAALLGELMGELQLWVTMAAKLQREHHF